MKFQKLEAFEKHIKDSFPDHLSPVYVVLCPNEQERKKILSSLFALFEKEGDVKKCLSPKEAIEHVNSRSLFAEKTVAIFEREEPLDKEEWELFSQYIGAPHQKSYLVLGVANLKNSGELYKKGKKEIILLDLSEEKPWEEKQRLQKWVVQTFLGAQKQITPDAIEAMFSQLPLDRLLLQQEIDKLLCFVGNRKEIVRKDIETICSTTLEIDSFQIAQQLIWNQGKNIPAVTDLSLLLPLIGQLRYQLELGLKIASFLQQGASPEEIAGQFPQLRPKTMQQGVEGARKKGVSFFKKGLQWLFDLEYGVKTSRGRPEALFILFCTKIGASE